MLDCVIRNGQVIDGTGAGRRPADIGIRDGRIVAVGHVPDQGRRVIDAGARVVAPGFIDLHTHYDAQVFWDPALTPSPLHGVTTVVAGNCGLTLAPIADRDCRYSMGLLGRVEGMPLASLLSGVPWGEWNTLAEYLDRLHGRVVPNMAVLVGHNALRMTVMGPDFRRTATLEELGRMVRLLEESLEAGGLGLSTSFTHHHKDSDGRPVPSWYASDSEVFALCGAVGRHPGTTLQTTGDLAVFTEDRMAFMTKMSLTADRPINWNAIFVNARRGETCRQNLGASDYAAQRGGGVLALAFPMATTARLNFASGVVLDAIPGWAPLFEVGPSRRAQILADRDERSRLAEEAARADAMGAYTSWATQLIGETFSPVNEGVAGRLVGHVAEERSQSPFDCLLDIVLADDLRTVLTTQSDGDDDESWQLRSDVLCDARVLVGASDAGAHLDMIDGFAYTTDLLGPSVRDRRLFSLERAVQLLTDIPARTYGFCDRGRIALGYCADLVVFDPGRIDHGPAHLSHDLPGGASRLSMVAHGIDHVFVNGVEVVKGGDLTGAAGGSVLRAGQHTETVYAGAIAERVQGRET